MKGINEVTRRVKWKQSVLAVATASLFDTDALEDITRLGFFILSTGLGKNLPSLIGWPGKCLTLTCQNLAYKTHAFAHSKISVMMML